MKVFTVERCDECPAYCPDHEAYYDEFGVCGRNRSIEIDDSTLLPTKCPLKEWKE